jgi:uncharacterized protein (TIGR02246 family)
VLARLACLGGDAVSDLLSVSWRLTAAKARKRGGKMRELLIAAVVFASLGSTAVAGPREDALQVVEKWTRAFTDSDVDGIVKLYASDALFLGTSSKTVVVAPSDIRRYFEQALLNTRPMRAIVDSYSAMVVSDTAVVVTGLDTVSGVRDGKPFGGNGRFTFVVAKRGPGWQIVHFHRSSMPR